MTADSRRPLIQAGITFLAAAAAALLIILGAQYVFARALENAAIAAWSPVLLESLFNIVVFGLLALVAALGIRLAGGRAGAGPHAARLTSAGLAAGCAGLALAILLSSIAGTAHAVGGGGARVMLLLAGAAVTLLQTGAEELYFRGWLQPHLETALGLPIGVGVTALAFAALHFVSGTFGVVSFANMALGGLWFGLLAQRSGGLALPIGAHFGWNWAEEMLFGATPNPGISHYTSLFDWDLAGATIWGGSADGLNASISATFVLVAFIIVTVCWKGAALNSPALPG